MPREKPFSQCLPEGTPAVRHELDSQSRTEQPTLVRETRGGSAERSNRRDRRRDRSEEHTSELQSHSFISYAVFFLKKKKKQEQITTNPTHQPERSRAPFVPHS